VPPRLVRIEEQEQIGGAVALVFIERFHADWK
jgi:hypothetical protein